MLSLLDQTCCQGYGGCQSIQPYFELSGTLQHPCEKQQLSRGAWTPLPVCFGAFRMGWGAVVRIPLGNPQWIGKLRIGLSASWFQESPPAAAGSSAELHPLRLAASAAALSHRPHSSPRPPPKGERVPGRVILEPGAAAGPTELPFLGMPRGSWLCSPLLLAPAGRSGCWRQDWRLLVCVGPNW